MNDFNLQNSTLDFTAPAGCSVHEAVLEGSQEFVMIDCTLSMVIKLNISGDSSCITLDDA